MKLIVGLGNPGPKYLLTRHNIGFLAVDSLHKSCQEPPWKEQNKALTSRFKWDDSDVMIIKPQTFMNLSGESVRPLMDYYKVAPDDLLVIYDDIDMPFGMLKFMKNRGAGGHNGIKSIDEQLGTQDYARLKLGVGRPPDARIDIANWVLSPFEKATEEPVLADFLNLAGDAIEAFVFHGLSKATSDFNGKRIELPQKPNPT
ncbi:MAG: aminoacyl-tRNA hydrolase [Bdellovibrionales bacterium CG10_big_fil_rev_8_21_14_0_10_45_34]|nr:MAG: aminoacyl-tRNA hydrolase [Bdellovibrionales bacterium CG10_big_fil_rev_8_21_14_0_10_45_34]